MEDLKIYTIDELSDLKKGRGPDKQERKKRGSSTGYRAEQRKKNKLRKQIIARREGEPSFTRQGVTYDEAMASRKSLGDCYTIDELYDLKKGKVYDPAAVAAAVGRKKYGAKKFAEMSAAGRSRKKAPKGKAKMRVGGGGRFAKLESEIASKNKGKK